MNKKIFAGAVLALLALLAGSAMAAAPEVACQLTGLQKAAGYLTFGNIVTFLAAVGIALFSSVVLYHIRDLFTSIPLARPMPSAERGRAPPAGACRWRCGAPRWR